MILVSEEQIKRYTEEGSWGNDTLSDLFLRNVSENPDGVAFVDAPNREKICWGKPMRLTFAEAKSAVDRLAANFIKAGIGKDDVVMVQLPNIVELPITYLAIARIGAIASPVPVQYRTHELKYTMSIVEPKAVVTTNNAVGFDCMSLFRNLKTDIPSLESIFVVGDSLPSDVYSFHDLPYGPEEEKVLEQYLEKLDVSANDVYSICWTSGTEADPKGVPRSHNHWIAIAWSLVDGCGLFEGCNILCPFPFINMSSIGGMFVPWLLAKGGKFVLHHPIDLPVMLGQIAQEQINYTVIPPAGLNMLAKNPEIMQKVNFSTVKSIGSGSAPLSPWMVREFQEKYGIYVINIFGSNEGIALISGPGDCPDPDDRAQYFPRWGVEGFRWNNRVGNWFKSKLVDPDTGEEIKEKGKSGEILISGPTVFAGYYKRPDLTAKSFDPQGYFHTGDMFCIDGEGDNPRFYRFTGRLKDIIIRGGVNISAEEVEYLVAEHPNVAEVAVVGFPDEKLGERICAVVVPVQGKSLTMGELKEFLKERDFAIYKTPEKLVLVDALPRNPVGKVVKGKLRALVAGDPSVQAEIMVAATYDE